MAANQEQPPSPDAETRTATPSARPRGDDDIAPAQALGRYMVLHKIGAGAMGQVYAAFDPNLDRRVALKLLHAEATPEDRLRLPREAKALARLSHPNVVTVHEVEQRDGHVLIAMEYVEGGTLKQWLA